MVTPEGEKLHSDSGISVDTQSLQEQQQQQAQAEVQAPPSQSHSQDQIGKTDYIQFIVIWAVFVELYVSDLRSEILLVLDLIILVFLIICLPDAMSKINSKHRSQI